MTNFFKRSLNFFKSGKKTNQSGCCEIVSIVEVADCPSDSEPESPPEDPAVAIQRTQQTRLPEINMPVVSNQNSKFNISLQNLSASKTGVHSVTREAKNLSLLLDMLESNNGADHTKDTNFA